MPSSFAPDRIELNTANEVLGGTFTSRINMNLREDKHWSYGARSSLTETRGQRPWLLSAPVQTDKTVESIQEIRRELADLLAAKPITADEVDKIRSRDVRALSGQYETNAAVSGAIGDIVRFGRPDDYVRTLRSTARRRRPMPVSGKRQRRRSNPTRSRGSSSATCRKSRRPFASSGSATCRCSTRTVTCCADGRAMIRA